MTREESKGEEHRVRHPLGRVSVLQVDVRTVIAMPTTSPVSFRSAIMNQFLSKTSCSSWA